MQNPSRKQLTFNLNGSRLQDLLLHTITTDLFCCELYNPDWAIFIPACLQFINSITNLVLFLQARIHAILNITIDNISVDSSP